MAKSEQMPGGGFAGELDEEQLSVEILMEQHLRELLRISKMSKEEKLEKRATDMAQRDINRDKFQKKQATRERSKYFKSEYQKGEKEAASRKKKIQGRIAGATSAALTGGRAGGKIALSQMDYTKTGLEKKKDTTESVAGMGGAAVGGGIGMALGGPIGAMLGSQIGQTAGNIIGGVLSMADKKERTAESGTANELISAFSRIYEAGGASLESMGSIMKPQVDVIMGQKLRKEEFVDFTNNLVSNRNAEARSFRNDAEMISDMYGRTPVK